MNTPTPTPRAEVERLQAIGSWAHTCIHHTDEQRAKAEGCPVCAAAELAGLRAHCESETKWAAHYLARSIAEKARAERAEDNLAALEQCHDDNCREVVKIADDLATERARLDSGQILLTVAGERVWHCGVDLRAAIDAGMQEDAK